MVKSSYRLGGFVTLEDLLGPVSDIIGEDTCTDWVAQEERGATWDVGSADVLLVGIGTDTVLSAINSQLVGGTMGISVSI